jgi:hypothetical protein
MHPVAEADRAAAQYMGDLLDRHTLRTSPNAST